MYTLYVCLPPEHRARIGRAAGLSNVARSLKANIYCFNLVTDIF